jgi:uncharacterized RDD family membrane protein YckC
MDSKIDFSQYSLNDLYSSAKSIDRDMYPERAKEIDALIQEKGIEDHQQVDESKNVGEKAARLDRLWAGLIDAVIHMVASIPLFMYFGMEALKDPTLLVTVVALVYGLVMILILQGYLLYHFGQTIGKNIMSIRIENLDGSKANLQKILLLRILPMSLCSVIPLVGQFFVGFVNPAFIFGKERRCLHDYIAKTQVSYTGT